jgi:hypothetical protein
MVQADERFPCNDPRSRDADSACCLQRIGVSRRHCRCDRLSVNVQPEETRRGDYPFNHGKDVMRNLAAAYGTFGQGEAPCTMRSSVQTPEPSEHHLETLRQNDEVFRTVHRELRQSGFSE